MFEECGMNACISEFISVCVHDLNDKKESYLSGLPPIMPEVFLSVLSFHSLR